MEIWIKQAFIDMKKWKTLNLKREIDKIRRCEIIRFKLKKKTEEKTKLSQIWKMKNKLEGAKGKKDMTENLIWLIEESTIMKTARRTEHKIKK